MARAHRAGLIIGIAAVVGGIYLFTKKTASAATAAAQGTGIQGAFNAGASLLTALLPTGLFSSAPATGGVAGQSSATPAQDNTPTLWPWDNPVGENGLPCTDVSNAADAACGQAVAIAVPSPVAATADAPLTAIPDFSPGGVSDAGSAYSSDQGATPDPTYIDFSGFDPNTGMPN